MAKRKKGSKAAAPADPPPADKPAGHPPRKQPVLLGVSIVLLVLWFVFLVVVAAMR
jgi:hypothetical protein